MKPRADLTRQLCIRLPEDMMDELIEDAEANGRTVAQTVRFRLERAYGLR